MDVKKVLRKLGWPSQGGAAYTSLPMTPLTPAMASQSDLSDQDEMLRSGSIAAPVTRFRLPTLSRFLADFTLGFADGLTVPFALTAGLSSLGQTETVIYAGMAEICAGSFSMGIGGYLSAKGEVAADARSGGAPDKVREEATDEEKVASLSDCNPVEDYLAPLCLPADLLDAVRAHVDDQPNIATTLSEMAEDRTSAEDPKQRTCPPIISGLSIALGYLLGGLLPLFPYFFVDHVGVGVRWSFAVCILALFVFGFTKHYVLQDESEKVMTSKWNTIRHSTWEGLQMVVLGSIAAIAALGCVNLFEGIVTS